MKLKLWATVLAFFGIENFTQVDGKNTLTEEQKSKLTDTFGEAFTAKLLGTFEANADEELPNGAAVVADLQTKLTAAENARQAAEAARIAAEKTTADQKKVINILSAKPEADPAAIIVPSAGATAWDDSNDKFLGGVSMPFMAIDDRHPYNKRAYAAAMRARGIDVPAPVASSFDYDSLKSDLGDYYRVRKQDRIQSFLLGLPSLDKVFGTESGYQDQAVLVNLFLEGDFSQADNTVGSSFDNLVKGAFKFEPEVLTMYDVMFVHKFTDLKTIEKNWLGYLNREGSNTMKWSFIEYIMIETTKKLSNERELRRIKGKRVNPTANTPGTALGAANGILQFIKNQLAAYKLRPFVMGEWNEANISDYIRRGTSYVPSWVRDTGMLVLYMSPEALTAYHKNNETLYGTNQDYKADINFVKEYPNVPIKTLPNMGPSKRMIWTLEGNIKLFEDVPGEMTKYYFEQQDWSLKVWSNWKESIWAYMVGKKHSSAAAIPTDYSTQLIFINDVDLPADSYMGMTPNDTTPSVAEHTSLVSVANTAATALTDIDDCAVGQEVRIKCGSTTNAITIAKSGKFSLLSAAWEPSLDDVIVLKKRSDGKFIELSRSNVAELAAIAIDPDDATPSVTGGTVFVTDANSQATAITNLDDAVAGVVYKLYGAGSTNASTIANSGNFVLTAAMTLSATKWIELQKSESDGKFYEINRG